MKPTNFGPEHGADIIRLRVAAGISSAPNPAAVVQQFQNLDSIAFIAGDVVVVDSGGIVSTTTAQDTRPVGIVQDDIAIGDTGAVLTAGYAALVNVTAAVSVDTYAETSTVAKQATANATARSGSFGVYLSSSATPDALLFGFTDGGTGVVPPNTYLTTTEGEQHAIVTVPASGAAVTIDCSLANIFDITLTANCTLTISNPPAVGVGGVITVILRQGGTGSYTVTWPASVKWQSATGTSTGSAPTLWTVVGAQDDIELSTLDGGVTWGASATEHAAGGTVTSVALTAPTEFSVGGSPITGAGTLAITKANETANTVWAGPTTGSAAQPTFRALVAADIPAVSGATDHEHLNSIEYNGDGATVAFELPAAPFDQFAVVASVAGVIQDVALSGTMLTTMTFASAPASGTNNIRVDIVAIAV